MKYLSILFLVSSLFSAAQRVEFNDPDLTFSFVKPSEWVVKDGPTVFVIPSDESLEEPITFFSITYFEEPVQMEGTENYFEANSNALEPTIPSDLLEFNPSKIGTKEILDEVALWASYYHTHKGVRIKAVSYVFVMLNQRFEIIISSPSKNFETLEEQFQMMIESIMIKE